MQTAMNDMRRPLEIPTLRTLMNLALGGVIGLAIWEIWARVLTKAVLGYPLEPAGLIDAIANHQFGLSVPWLLREALHYGVGIFGYPIAYYVISRFVKGWSLLLDIIVFATFSAGVAYHAMKGAGSAGQILFWLVVTVFIATRFVNRDILIRDSITWGTFTWLNALGIMAPIGGLSFYLLGEGGALSFMSFAGHVIYGAVAAYVFEKREEKMLK
jgi:hypothetical protein